MLPRTLEPESMDDPAEAASYDDMNHSSVNIRFVDDLLAGGEIGNDILDLGTGTAQIPILLCERMPEVRIMALDAAASMLELAIYNIEIASAIERIQLMQGDAKAMDDFEDEMFDCVMCNSLIHHLPEPQPTFAEIHRLTAIGGRIFVRDLCRPDSETAVEALVAQYAADESEIAQQLFRQSLHAALTLDEVQQMVAAAGLPRDSVQMTSDRHWTLDVRKTTAHQEEAAS
ncbi:Ubiquinone/menaquinone biosynthesis C-methyltransferase UbiE [Rosistilla ulvae]|uniref:Ubiquinone/menaquinone biosynthesis C-methyltransferase UbiE n=1 Tax=Rosistilla ulvae TaxID=1930277 RepID=A0A517LYA0_9BACT|nr:class I SAM-dependent methyltransferase [Rosistilla ulvae]QDS87589.1 Ubiquinone/menaquinone biosynthesis C-methyltransferase UbiE [Rosistilla ulvae]